MVLLFSTVKFHMIKLVCGISPEYSGESITVRVVDVKGRLEVLEHWCKLGPLREAVRASPALTESPHNLRTGSNHPAITRILGISTRSVSRIYGRTPKSESQRIYHEVLVTLQ